MAKSKRTQMLLKRIQSVGLNSRKKVTSLEHWRLVISLETATQRRSKLFQ